MTKKQIIRNDEILNMYSNKKIELGRIYVLIDMARHDECPDSTFSDDECVLWSSFRRMLGK